MRRVRLPLARAAAVIGLSLFLQGSSCTVHFSSDVDDDDDDDHEATVVMLPPRLDPWGRPLTIDALRRRE